MRTATSKEIKTELESQPPQVLLELCLKLTRFKKENKELLTYLLFEKGNEAGYIDGVKALADDAFTELNIRNVYIAKKNLRKILRSLGRFIKYSGIKTTEAALLIYFCKKVKSSGLDIKKSAALSNLYASQVKKINAAVNTLHEDLQYDYTKEMERL